MIRVIDAVMGTGKSTWAIEQIQANLSDGPYVIATPLLSEVERYAEAIPGSVSLLEGEGKLKRYKEALVEGKNVILTQSMFQNFDDDCLSMLPKEVYLIMMKTLIDLES